MTAYLLGVVLFALGIIATVALHEAGHMLTARAFGMRVRRFFVGFGPQVVSVRRGHTEYGFAAVPLGGFCDIAGMTGQDPVTAEEAPYAMVNKPWWQRVIVLSGGVAVNLLLGVSILYGLAVLSGVPNPHVDRTPVVGEVVCTADQNPETGELEKCTGVGAAGRAGVSEGDRITAIDGHAVRDFAELAKEVSARPGETIQLTVNGVDVPVTVDTVTRYTKTGEPLTVGAIGLASRPADDLFVTYNPIDAVPATFALSGQVLSATVEGLGSLPMKIPGVVASIFGGERDQDSPMSVVGASRVGGELVQQSDWGRFWFMLASLNFFIALFNLIPLPPLDGGHIAVVLYEKLRRRGPADYEKFMPLTYSVWGVTLLLGILFIVADLVNPVRLYG